MDSQGLQKPPLYYRLLICLIKPLYRLWLIKKSGKKPTYQREIAERFGRSYLPVPTQKRRGLIWCHAVSLGEINTALPLLNIFLNQGFNLWITNTTQTGFNRTHTLFGDKLGRNVQHSFVPVDDMSVIEQFLQHIKPSAALFIETELWANTLYLLKKQHIPSMMVNARLTQKSFLGYQKWHDISRTMMANLSLIITQDNDSYQRFIALGANSANVKRADSLKWASSIVMDDVNKNLLAYVYQNSWSINRPIWTAGSTHKGEDEIILSAHQKLLQDFPDALLILVPRHPERFEDVAKLTHSFITHRRSQNQSITQKTQIYLADSMGELLAWYALANVVFVGGSLIDVGGHNPIEPASLGKPIIMGSYVKNCELLVSELKNMDALTQVDDDVTLYKALFSWLKQPADCQTLGEKAKKLTLEKQNAAQIQFDYLKLFLSINDKIKQL